MEIGQLIDKCKKNEHAAWEFLKNRGFTVEESAMLFSSLLYRCHAILGNNNLLTNSHPMEHSWLPDSISLGVRERFAILESFDFACAYCGRKAPEVSLQIDHIYPKSKGGTSIRSNLAPICQECNLGKHNKILPQKIIDSIRKIYK